MSRTAADRAQSIRALEILAVARDVLEEGDVNDFTIRKIAGRLGMYVRNVTYYFPRKQDLIEAVLAEKVSEYDQRIEAIVAAIGPDAETALRAVIEFYVTELRDPVVRRTALRIWALLATQDAYNGGLLEALYSRNFASRFIPLIAAALPDLSDDELTLRAQMVASLIEGAILFAGAQRLTDARVSIDAFFRRCASEAVSLALGNQKERS